MYIERYYGRLQAVVALFLVTGCGLWSTTASGQARQIKPGDAIEITVYGQEELNKTVVVSNAGTIEYPFLQGIPLDGLTLQRLQEVIVAQLARYMERPPFVTVQFSEFYPIKVIVLGQVVRPGIFTLSNRATIQNALYEAGGLAQGAQVSKIRVVRKDSLKNRNQVVDMERFYREGDYSYLPALNDGDTIVVPGNPLATNVKVLGAVVRPGTYDVSFGLSLLDVLFMAGGPSPDANLKKIKLVSLSGQLTREVRIDMNNVADSENYKNIPLVVPGDVVFVPKSPLSWRKFMNFLRDMTIFATLTVIILRGT